MKKFYNDPTIKLSLFKRENILTASAGSTEDSPKSVTEAATSFFNRNIGEDATIVNFVL